MGSLSSLAPVLKSNLKNGALWQTALGFAVTVHSAKGEPPDQRFKTIAQGILIDRLAYHPNGFVMAGKGLGFNLALSAVELGFMAGSALKTGLENRMSLAIPFSHNTFNMQQAQSSIRYAQQQTGKAYGSVGQEAGIYASRYLRR